MKPVECSVESYSAQSIKRVVGEELVLPRDAGVRDEGNVADDRGQRGQRGVHRAGDRGRLVAAFRKYAQAHLTAPDLPGTAPPGAADRT